MDTASALDENTPEISDAQLQTLFAAIEHDGYCCVPDFLAPASLVTMQEFVESSVRASRNEYVAFKGSEAVKGSGLDQLAYSTRFQSIFSRLYVASCNKPAPAVEFYQILRCLTGKGMMQHSLNFHYDSYLLTALIPIVIPTAGRAGDLLLVPNTRPVRETYARNLVDKVMVDKIRQGSLKNRAARNPLSFTRIKMVPGNLYLFWGYRTIHANEPCDPNTVRATALYHYFDPHADSRLKARLGRRAHVNEVEPSVVR
ncbi:hypothetical protein QTL95_24255 [Rhizobium sp. S152]|uniref:hypothetical protein n=1 Tax=Rhizobium sp. S152 TaxID=3055038 RepID=UPI0025A9EF85|nr:hypothetical protein [Rhizobium sp. S152]MDM9629015.1 hypothetical protein [Rhizobium sp. S152]